MTDSQSNPLHVDFCGLSFDSPIVLLSGCVGFGEEYTRVEGFSNRDVGGIVLKGTTREPRLGNKPHRVCETPMGMLNAIGLQNPGVDKVVDDILAFREVTGDFGEIVYAGVDFVDPELAKRSLELMASEVMPRVNEAIARSAAAE